MNIEKPRKLPLYLCFFGFLSAFWVYYFILKKQGAQVFWPALWQGDYFSIDWRILHDHLWSSLLYYHVQLPFYLFYTYLFEHVFFPPDGFIGHYVLNTLAGLGMIYAVYRLQINNGVNPWLAALIILCFVISPAFYANYSMGWHDYLTACLIAISAYLFYKAVSTKTLFNYFAFFMMLAIIGNIRALYHPILFFLPTLCGMLLIIGDYKKILLAALLPTILFFAPYVKNKILFDTFNVSTHSGRIMVQTTYEFYMPNDIKIKLVSEGKLSELAFCIHPEKKPDVIYGGKLYDKDYCENVVKEKYANEYIQQHPQFANIPILQTRGSNYLGNIGYNRENTRNALSSAIYMPQEISKGMREKWRTMFKPNITYYFGNMINVRHLPNWMSYNTLNIWPGSKNTPGTGGTLEERSSLFLVIAFPLLLLFGITKVMGLSNVVNFHRAIFLTAIIVIGFYLQYLHKTMAAWEKLSVEYHVLYLMFFLFCIALAIIIFKIRKHGKAVWENIKKPHNLTFLYITFLILYTCILTSLLVGTEHQRYRQYIDPMILVLLGTYLTEIWLLWFKFRIQQSMQLANQIKGNG